MDKVNKAIFDTNTQCCDIMNNLINKESMKKINIVELLKYCPSGMELDCVSYDNVSFDKISDDKKATYPIFCYITDKEGNRSGISFTENGCESKRYGAKCVIFPKGKTSWEGFIPPCKFKDGDSVRGKYTNKIYTISCITPTGYKLTNGKSFTFNDENCYELIYDKFDITTLIPFESKVLVRDNVKEKWHPGIWGYYDENSVIIYQYRLIGDISRYCIPYEGNEHLLGTTDDCSNYFKTWE